MSHDRDIAEFQQVLDSVIAGMQVLDRSFAVAQQSCAAVHSEVARLAAERDAAREEVVRLTAERDSADEVVAAAQAVYEEQSSRPGGAGLPLTMQALRDALAGHREGIRPESPQSARGALAGLLADVSHFAQTVHQAHHGDEEGTWLACSRGACPGLRRAVERATRALSDREEA